MKVKNLLKIVIIAVVLVLLENNYTLATIQMESKSGTIPWNNITVTNSFDECLKLNNENSTLGTDKLQAHLSTDADWSAMAIFSASQFGGATMNQPAQTNNNASGIYGMNYNGYFQTTGIYEGTTSANFTLLLKPENGKYVKKYKLNRKDNSNVWFKTTSDNGTYGYFGSLQWYGSDTEGPGSIKHGLFSVQFLDRDNSHRQSQGNKTGYIPDGYSYDNVSFRPVLWN